MSLIFIFFQHLSTTFVSSDLISIVLGLWSLVISWRAYAFTRKVSADQNAIVSQMRDLQTEMAELEILEKLGVIPERAIEATTEKKAVFTAVGDICAVLAGYSSAPESLRKSVRENILESFRTLEQVRYSNNGTCGVHIRQAITERIKLINDQKGCAFNPTRSAQLERIIKELQDLRTEMRAANDS